jgi:hypothetical protein
MDEPTRAATAAPGTTTPGTATAPHGTAGQPCDHASGGSTTAPSN